MRATSSAPIITRGNNKPASTAAPAPPHDNYNTPTSSHASCCGCYLVVCAVFRLAVNGIRTHALRGAIQQASWPRTAGEEDAAGQAEMWRCLFRHSLQQMRWWGIHGNQCRLVRDHFYRSSGRIAGRSSAAPAGASGLQGGGHCAREADAICSRMCVITRQHRSYFY